MFESLSIKVPNLKSLNYFKTYSKVYIYLERYGFSEEGFERAAKVFKRKSKHLRAIVLKVKTLLESMNGVLESVKDVRYSDEVSESLSEIKDSEDLVKLDDTEENEFYDEQ
jgi:virulence-associated protein VapD